MSFSDELAQTAADVEDIFGVAITLTSVTPGAMNYTTGARAETTASQSIDANRLPIERLPFRVGDGGRPAGEMRAYWVRAASITVGGGTPAAGWRITDTDSAVLDVCQAVNDCDRLGWILVARKAG